MLLWVSEGGQKRQGQREESWWVDDDSVVSAGRVRYRQELRGKINNKWVCWVWIQLYGRKSN